MSFASFMTRIHAAGGTPLFGRGGGSRKNHSAETPWARGMEATDRAVTSRSRVFGSQSVRTGRWSIARTDASAAQMDISIDAASKATLDQRIPIAFGTPRALDTPLSLYRHCQTSVSTTVDIASGSFGFGVRPARVGGALASAVLLVALDLGAARLGALGALGHRQLGRGSLGRLVADIVRLEEAHQRRDLDREVHVLRDVAGGARDRHGVELGHHHAHQPASLVDCRAAAVAGLHRGRYLDVARVVAQAGERGDVAQRGVASRRQRLGERIAEHQHRLGRLDRRADPELQEALAWHGARRTARSSEGLVASRRTTLVSPPFLRSFSSPQPATT